MDVRDKDMKPSDKKAMFPQPWECPKCGTVHSPYKSSCNCQVLNNRNRDNLYNLDKKHFITL